MTARTRNDNDAAGQAKQYGRVPYGAIDAGIVAAMTAADRGVYIVIAAHANGIDWSATPGVARIASLTGHNRRTVQRSIDRLERLGALTVEHGGGRAKCNRYTLTTNPAVLNCNGKRRQPYTALTTDKQRCSNATVSNEEERHRGARRAASRTEKSGTITPPEQQETALSQQQPSSSASLVDTAGPGEAEKMAIVRDRFGDRTAEGVSEYLDGHNFDHILKLADAAAGKRNPRAWFRTALRDNYDLPTGDPTMPPLQSPEQAARNRGERCRVQYGAALSYMTPDDLHQLPPEWRTVTGLASADPLGDTLSRLAPLDAVLALLELCKVSAA